MRITSKGQVTIPADIREWAGLLPHTEVEFENLTGRSCWSFELKDALAGAHASPLTCEGVATSR
jgi:AbrB family looped-hinge helix DNA binding protein